jgi:hypothetical protein
MMSSEYLQKEKFQQNGDLDLTNRSIFNYVLQDVPRQGHVDTEYLSKHINLNPESRGEPVGNRLEFDMTHGRSKRESSGFDTTSSWMFPVSEARTDYTRIPFESKSKGEGRAIGAEVSYSRFTPLVPNMAAFVEKDVPLDGHAIGRPSRMKGDSGGH